MNFKTNFNKLCLLGNEPVKIIFNEEKTVEFLPPSIRVYLLDLDFAIFKGILSIDVDSLNKQIDKTHFLVETQYDVLMTLLKTGYEKNIILKYLNLIFPSIEYKNDMLYSYDSPIEADEYDILIKMLNISCAEEEIDSFLKQTESQLNVKKLSPAQEKLKKNQEKIEALKKKKLKDSEDKKSSAKTSITIDQIVVALIYEFGFKVDEIYAMNMFTILYYWSYISKIVDTQIQVVAAGNGLTKEFTYFIN